MSYTARIVGTMLTTLVVLGCRDTPSESSDTMNISEGRRAAPTYTIVDLGSRSVRAINDRGQQVGTTVGSDLRTHAALWNNDVLTDLGPGYATDINNRGQVVGATGDRHAALWFGGVMTDLGTLGGRTSEAIAINDKGHVVGWSNTTGDTALHAFLWKNGVMTDLGTLGARHSRALDINDDGQVVGYFEVTPLDRRPFLWDDGVMTELHHDGTRGSADAVNDRGEIVGRMVIPVDDIDDPEELRALLWTRNGTMINLGNLHGNNSYAADINERGQVVGSDWAMRPDIDRTRPTLWDNGVVIDLGTLGGDYGEAFRINDRGVILGVAETSSEEVHTVLWVPTR